MEKKKPSLDAKKEGQIPFLVAFLESIWTKELNVRTLVIIFPRL